MAPNIGMYQSMHLKQQLVMTQRLQQALKLLQVPTLELEQILRQELQGNPLLEEIEPEEELEDETSLDREMSEMEDVERSKENEPEDEDRRLERELGRGLPRRGHHRDGWDEDDELERPQKYIPSGQEDLTEQLHLAVPEGIERAHRRVHHRLPQRRRLAGLPAGRDRRLLRGRRGHGRGRAAGDPGLRPAGRRRPATCRSACCCSWRPAASRTRTRPTSSATTSRP